MMIKLHFYYLFSKVNILIMSIILILISIIYIVNINIFDNYILEFINKKEILINYQNIYIMITKLLNILFSCYLFGYAFYYTNDNYCVLFDHFRNNRLPFLLSKILVLTIISILYNIIIYLLYLLIGIIGNRYFNFEYISLNIFLQSIFICLIYGYISSSLVLMLKSYFVILIPYVLFVISEIITNDIFASYYRILFPTLLTNNVNYILLIFLIINYLLILTICYLKHEV